MKTYVVEVTDLFCGDLNYSYVTRMLVTASSERGAANKVGRYYAPLSFRKQKQYGDADKGCAIYHSTTKLTGYTMKLLNEYNAPENENIITF